MSASKVCPQCGTEYPANARFCETDGTALRSAKPNADLVGSIVADRYHIMRKLGEGGMGQVYLAEHVKMGRKSALKVMRASMKADVEAVSRFNREAANASRIAHPNVAAVYDFGETREGIIYLAMEYVDGSPLTKIIEQGALPPKRAAGIVRQTAEALAAAHDMGIVHRDLKPDNVMIARNRDGSDCVKVVDFGIAKAAGNDAQSVQNVTKTGLIVGTPEYMSPEQLAGDKLDGRSDIYALGLLAYHMLTGRLPFSSDSAQESMIMRLTDKPKPLAETKPETSWPAGVQAVMDKALERDANARYQNAVEFAVALYTAVDAMLGDSAVPATRVGPGAEFAPTLEMAKASAGPRSVTQVADSSKKSNKVPAVVAVVAAAAVVLAVIIGAMRFGGNDKTATSLNIVADARQVRVANSAVPAGSPQTKQSGSAAPDVDAQLAALLKDAQARVTADAVLRRVGSLDLQTDDQKAEGAYVRAEAYLTKDDLSSACKELKDIVDDFQGSRRVRDARKLIEAGC